jgi:hypothetical protein
LLTLLISIAIATVTRRRRRRCWPAIRWPIAVVRWSTIKLRPSIIGWPPIEGWPTRIGWSAIRRLSSTWLRLVAVIVRTVPIVRRRSSGCSVQPQWRPSSVGWPLEGRPVEGSIVVVVWPVVDLRVYDGTGREALSDLAPRDGHQGGQKNRRAALHMDPNEIALFRCLLANGSTRNDVSHFSWRVNQFIQWWAHLFGAQELSLFAVMGIRLTGLLLVLLVRVIARWRVRWGALRCGRSRVH